MERLKAKQEEIRSLDARIDSIKNELELQDAELTDIKVSTRHALC